jgi:hypothetical protein
MRVLQNNERGFRLIFTITVVEKVIKCGQRLLNYEIGGNFMNVFW